MKLYIIRRKSDGAWLPLKRQNGAGATYQNPTKKYPPRLYRRKGDATTSLRRWLNGHYTMQYEYIRSSSPIGEDDLFQMHIEIKPVPGRNSEDMEVTEVELITKDSQ